MNEMKLIRFKALKEKLGGVSRSTIDRWEAIGLFPSRIKLGNGIIGWIEKEIDEWIRERREYS